MKNIKLYELEETYRNEESSLKYPTVSYTKDTEKVHYLIKTELYEWVDLGLPSGLKWADRNVGATKPEEYGLYFAWGETQGYTEPTDEKQFSWSDYTLCDGTKNNMTKYNATDGLTTLEATDDAATATDSSCRMPTEAELRELRANTTSGWTQVNDVNGCIFTSKVNGNSIFVPARGYCVDGAVRSRSIGGLRTSSLYSSNVQDAMCFFFDSADVTVGSNSRYYGFHVRAVKE